MPDGSATKVAKVRKGKSDATIAILYTRRSTGKQDLTHEAQAASARAWASREGVTIAAALEDTISGGDAIEDCPGLLAAIDALREHGAGVLLVAKRDRIARDVMKVGMLEHVVAKQGARIVSAAGEGNGTDPTDVLLRGIVDLFAQHEKLMIRLRTKSALAVKRGRGEKLGGRRPFGFDVAPGTRDASGERWITPPRLVPNAAEQEIVRVIRELAATMGTHAIVSELARRGIVTRAGGRFSRVTIDRVIKGAG